MTKRILSLILALIAVAGIGITGVSATDTDTVSDQVIYFEVPDSWEGYQNVYCHVSEYNGDTLLNWQSKKGLCTETDTEGLYSYDLQKLGGIKEGTFYYVIFSTDTGNQHLEVLFSTECIGDTVYCTDIIYDNPQSTHYPTAFWRNQDASEYGPVMQFTSIGTINGTALPPNTDATEMFTWFITSGVLNSARTYSGKSDQDIIDGIAESLNLTDATVDKIIRTYNVNVDWAIASALLGDANCSGSVDITDTTAIQKHIAQIPASSRFVTKCADADSDGTVTVKDATAVQKHIAEIAVLF